MSKETEIEEMAKEICKNEESQTGCLLAEKCDCKNNECHYYDIAEALHYSGYRKADELQSENAGLISKVEKFASELKAECEEHKAFTLKANDEIEQLKHEKAVLEKALKNCCKCSNLLSLCANMGTCKTIEEVFSAPKEKCEKCKFNYYIQQAEKELAEEQK